MRLWGGVVETEHLLNLVWGVSEQAVSKPKNLKRKSKPNSEPEPSGKANRFLEPHATVSNLFDLGRYLIRTEHWRNLRMSVFAEWSRAVARQTSAGFLSL